MSTSTAVTSDDGVQCWVAAGDVETRRQSFTPRRATPRYFHLPFADEVPKKSVPDLVADIHEGLEEVFDRPDSRAPFIPGYANRDDAIVRAALLRSLGREGTDVILVRLTRCEPRIRYRRLSKYAADVKYEGGEEDVDAEAVLILCEPFTTANVVQRLQVLE
ncbi:hypothetical protein VFPFJ_03804 [Purpureocillium lilacinum]|uniref:Uncharacterized protein n=1 Tax=Purpureocillium lilacinum TaxID=33203 RepID=A0A179GW70_PURLI|nr:hypothetical protein VFPFJ_03804 [Purpureocillium lilacinum]KAK4087804.1 hypothetical protein Purlil1_7861 [Purpureocillium lilacinum]OAQ82012.1 hypothetical protein VFPBJ_04596 [Purpureocillium lilacinum]OAQ92064.1 hypothetical protein VFPFJ_03804 [Purpureocillium lilacinum]GJN73371.1 hypothetical protein PLICBS_007449 [Purpureocillium lilacinum]GJN83884.1 hypothetical protein PLIIFM63780_007435 [Purpureocillium lilacinum]